MNIVTGKQQKPLRAVFYGPEGIGKSTLASHFPNPLFLDLEGGTNHMDVARMPVPSSWTMLKQFLGEFRRDTMGYSTLVVDTADWAERMCTDHICAERGLESLGGQNDYGRSYNLLYVEWAKFLDFLTEIRDACGVHVVLLAHAHMRKFEQPDEAGAYDRWELKLERKTGQIMKEWADTVLFGNYRTIVVEVDNKKKAQGGKRVIYTTHHPCWDAKNRLNLSDQLDMPPDGLPPELAAAVETVPPTMQANQPVQPIQPIQPTQPVPQPQTAPQQPTVAQAAHPAPQTPPRAIVDSTAFNTKLYDLMSMHGVSEQEIQAVVAAKGYYPVQTPIGNYDEKFVDGVLVAAWEKVYAAIQAQREQAA